MGQFQNWHKAFLEEDSSSWFKMNKQWEPCFFRHPLSLGGGFSLGYFKPTFPHKIINFDIIYLKKIAKMFLFYFLYQFIKTSFITLKYHQNSLIGKMCAPPEKMTITELCVPLFCFQLTSLKAIVNFSACYVFRPYVSVCM